MSSTESPLISTVAVQVEYYDAYTRLTTIGAMLEYNNFALSTVALLIEYKEGLPLMLVGQYYQESTQ